jgi:hypothetical protein
MPKNICSHKYKHTLIYMGEASHTLLIH